MSERERIAELEEENAYLKGILADLTGRDAPVAGLPPKQSALVRLLERAGGRVVAKTALHDAIYHDRPEAPCLKILDVFVSHIRRRRPDLGARIVTHWGVGWALLPEDAAGAGA